MIIIIAILISITSNLRLLDCLGPSWVPNPSPDKRELCQPCQPEVTYFRLKTPAGRRSSTGTLLLALLSSLLFFLLLFVFYNGKRIHARAQNKQNRGQDRSTHTHNTTHTQPFFAIASKDSPTPVVLMNPLYNGRFIFVCTFGLQCVCIYMFIHTHIITGDKKTLR